MRVVAASLAALGLLGLFFPVVCMQGEFDEGSCSSVVGIRLPGTTGQAGWWQLIVFAAAVLVAVLVVRVFRGNGSSSD